MKINRMAFKTFILETFTEGKEQISFRNFLNDKLNKTLIFTIHF